MNWGSVWLVVAVVSNKWFWLIKHTWFNLMDKTDKNWQLVLFWRHIISFGGNALQVTRVRNNIFIQVTSKVTHFLIY